MTLEPQIEYHNEQRYAAIFSKVTRHEIPALLPPLIPELFNWLEKHNNIEPAGPPFFSYLKMEGDSLEVEVGIPVNQTIETDGRVREGIFPAGKYAWVTYTGHYNNLYKVHTELDKWRKENNIKLKGNPVEFYPTDPVKEPNPDKWQTIIVQQVDED